MRLPTNRPPIHPGEILYEEFMKPYGISENELSRKIGIDGEYLRQVINAEEPVSADMALRLSKLFGTSPELWLNGQIACDVWNAMHGENAVEIESIEPLNVIH